MSKKVEKRKCAVCGKAFTPKSPNATVCGEKCRKVNRANHKKARAAKPKLVEKIKLGKQKSAAKPSKPAATKTVRASDALPEPLVAGVLKLIDIDPRLAIAFGKAVVDTAIKSIGEKMFDTLMK